MKLTLTLLTIALSLSQAMIAYFWQKEPANIKNRFVQMLQSFNAKVPAWTEMAFSWNEYWYLISASLILASIIAYVKYQAKWIHSVITLLALSTTASMVYAMYPLDVMFWGNYV